MGWLSNTVFYVLSALPILFTAVQVVQLDYLKRLDTSLKGFQCTELFREEVVGMEDMTAVAPGILLGSSDDRLRLWENPRFGPEKTPDGAIFALYGVDSDQRSVEALELSGFPAGVAFHPHGIFFHRPSSCLYVVNHAYHRGGERIDIFNVALRGGKVSLSYSSSLRSPLFDVEAMGALNDLVVLGPAGEEQLYITQYRAFPDGPHGRLSDSVVAVTHERLNLLQQLFMRKWTRIIHCSSKEGGCSSAEGGYGGLSFNGISHSPDQRRLVVADMKQVVVFDIEGPGKLSRRQVVPTAHVTDNIEPVPGLGEGEEVWTLGAVGKVHEFLKHNFHYYEQEDGDRDRATAPPVSGGTQLLRRDPTTGEYVREEVVMTDGAALSLISCSVSLGGHGNSYLMGSWGDRGLLLCTASPTDEGRPTGTAGGARDQQEL